MDILPAVEFGLLPQQTMHALLLVLEDNSNYLALLATVSSG